MKFALCVDHEVMMSLADEARLLPSLSAQTSPNALVGERVSSTEGRGLNFSSLRQYQPGDDTRLIDWQATARLHTPWVRLYNEERERPIFLIVDQRLDMFFATQGQTKSSAAARIAGLMAWRCWHDGERIGSMLFNDSSYSQIKCRHPRSNLTPLINDIILYNQLLPIQYPREVPEDISLTTVLQLTRKLIPTGAWVAVISDFHDLDKKVEALLVSLKHRCEVNAFVVLDDLHMRLPSDGILTTRHRLNKATFSLSNKSNKILKQAIINRLALREERLIHLGIQVNQIVASQDMITQLRRGMHVR